MAWDDFLNNPWVKIGTSVAGGLLGASGNSSGETKVEQEKMDPRMDRYVYGPDGQSGLLGSAFSLMQEQMKNGGLNDLQRQGMEMQRQFLMSPQYQQGYGSMMGLGQSLMSAPIAGNPFTRGNPFNQGMSFQRDGASNMPMFNYTGNMNAQLPNYSQFQPQLRTQQVPSTAGMSGAIGGNGSGNGGVGGGGGSSSMGQGISSATISAALAALAASENPALRAIAPTVAAALGLGGGIAADGQIGAISNSFGALGNIANMGVPGIGSYSDADGNVMSISTPGMIDAADRAMFGGDFGGYNSGGVRGGFAGTSNDGYGGDGMGGFGAGGDGKGW